MSEETTPMGEWRIQAVDWYAKPAGHLLPGWGTSVAERAVQGARERATAQTATDRLRINVTHEELGQARAATSLTAASLADTYTAIKDARNKGDEANSAYVRLDETVAQRLGELEDSASNAKKQVRRAGDDADLADAITVNHRQEVSDINSKLQAAQEAQAAALRAKQLYYDDFQEHLETYKDREREHNDAREAEASALDAYAESKTMEKSHLRAMSTAEAAGNGLDHGSRPWDPFRGRIFDETVDALLLNGAQ